MRKMNIAEMRGAEGGWVGEFAKAVARLRLACEHAWYGQCRTRYYGFGIYCPVCGKYTA